MMKDIINKPPFQHFNPMTRSGTESIPTVQRTAQAWASFLSCQRIDHCTPNHPIGQGPSAAPPDAKGSIRPVCSLASRRDFEDFHRSSLFPSFSSTILTSAQPTSECETLRKLLRHLGRVFAELID